MIKFLEQLPPSSIDVLILLAVVVFKAVIGHFSQSLKFSIFSIYCQQLALKVNKPSSTSSHKKIAGLIATTITLLPIAIILWLFESLIEVPWMWSALLLYFSFGNFQLSDVARQEFQLLSVGKKYEAKELITPYTLRDTGQLSPMGLSKATIEMLILKKLQLYFGIGFYFLLLGPLAAVCYRILLELHYHWNIKCSKNRDFGKFPHFVSAISQWLPARLLLISMIIISIRQPIGLLWRLVKKSFFQLNNNIIIHFLALELDIKLGGVAMYNGKKIRRDSFNDQGHQPNASHIIQAIRYLNLVITLVIGLLVSSIIITTSLII